MLLIKKILIVLCLVSMPSIMHAKCASKKEMKALNFKTMQSNMMVGALACQEQKNYNKLIIRSREAMSDFGDVINSYFKNRYGKADYQDKLDEFVTFIANKSTENSQNVDPIYFCDRTQHLLRAFLSADVENLEEFANENFSHFHEIKKCK